MNGNLNCSATNCTHNNSGACFAGAINVAGNSATSTSNTSCTSFVEGSFGSLTNCSDCNCTKPEHIICQAEKCKYNENKSCIAENVKINAQDASCETFVCK